MDFFGASRYIIFSPRPPAGKKFCDIFHSSADHSQLKCIIHNNALLVSQAVLFPSKESEGRFLSFALSLPIMNTYSGEKESGRMRAEEAALAAEL